MNRKPKYTTSENYIKTSTELSSYALLYWISGKSVIYFQLVNVSVCRKGKGYE